MGTGGERYGAGRPGWRRKCERLLSLDVRRMAREGCLIPGRAGGWQWSRSGEPFANIGYRAEASCLRLTYTWTPPGGDPLSLNYPVWLTRTPCNFGGVRLWFVCPRCARRCAVIYGLARDGRFGCRQCLRLGYSGEAESVSDRTWRRQRKLEAQLERKGIRQRTFDRIMSRIEECEQRRDIALAPSLARLLARLDPELADELHRKLNEA
jgi:hypothetical protein